jgi:pimeloyl-ACP methyl ester carboxylesterase
MDYHVVAAGQLNIAYRSFGAPDGWPCVLCHGFPYDVEAYAEAGPRLAAKGARVIVPYLRGYGQTRFIDAGTPRSGEQAALATDLLALLDALRFQRAVLAGYDWGGRAACIVSALWPERVVALVSGGGYNIQNIARSSEPAAPAQEAAFWYQYYLHTARGRRGLEENRRAFVEYLWRTWSPTWAFDTETFARSAPSFDNPDFVDVVVHSYRHRYGVVAGDPACADIEARLTAQPSISVPSITIDGDADGVASSTAHHANMFVGPHRHLVFQGAGHNLPQERPELWADAVLAARAMAHVAH